MTEDYEILQLRAERDDLRKKYIRSGGDLRSMRAIGRAFTDLGEALDAAVQAQMLRRMSALADAYDFEGQDIPTAEIRAILEGEK